MKQVLIVDDQNIVLQGIASLLSVSDEIEIMAMFESAEACIDFLQQGHRPDVILMDMHMPGMKGLEALPLVQQYTGAPVLFLTTFDDAYLRQQSRQLGAKGLLHKNISLELLVSSVLDVAGGASLFKDHERSEQEVFTPREDHIARALVEGKTNKEIARAQNLSPGTVRNYLSNVFGKLGVRNRSEAVVKLKELGLF